MLMPQRSYNASVYRYGFNGKENDNEVKGVPGSQQDYGMRIYDPRVGRFLSVDPLMHDFPWNSVYSFAEDDPINFIDLDGEEQQRPRNPGGAARPGIRGPLTNPGEIQAEGVLARVRLVRSQRVRQEDELHFRRMNNDPIYRTNYIRSQQFSLGAARQGYFQNAINSAQLVFSNGGVTQNKKLGDQWDNLVNTSMLKNPSYVGVARQISLKITGRINGQEYTANVRVDNVGIMNVNGKVSLNLVEAKFSINEITINNVKQTLTPQQRLASDILINGTNVQFFIRGDGSASMLTSVSASVGTKFVKGQNITGMINEIQVITPRPTQVSPSKAP